MIKDSQCVYCRRLRSGENGIAVCSAFPEGIPDEVLFGPNDHRNPYPGDHGIRFEAKNSDADSRQRSLFMPLPLVAA